MKKRLKKFFRKRYGSASKSVGNTPNALESLKHREAVLGHSASAVYLHNESIDLHITDHVANKGYIERKEPQ